MVFEKSKSINYKILILFIQFIICVAEPDGVCQKQCKLKADSLWLHYQPGYWYNYAFNTKLSIEIPDKELQHTNHTFNEKSSDIHMSGVARISTNGDCSYTLLLKDVDIKNTNQSIIKRLDAGIGYPVIFSIENGKLDPYICASKLDATYSLNIKRAIISLLHSRQHEGTDTETDIFGTCSADVKKVVNGDIEITTETRDVNSCEYGHSTGLSNKQASVYSEPKLISEYLKTSKHEAKLLKFVELVEYHRPKQITKFGYFNCNVNVTSTLNYKGAESSASEEGKLAHPKGFQSVSIVFEKPQISNIKNIAEIQTNLNGLVKHIGKYAQFSSSYKFIELIRIARKADVATLLELAKYAKAHPDRALAWKVYLDVLFRTNTRESAKAILSQIMQFSEKEQILAILSFNTIDNIDRETLTVLNTILASNLNTDAIYLTVGNAIAKYCQLNDCSVPGNREEITAISKKLTNELKACTASSKRDEDRYIHILKAIGNSPDLAQEAAQTLIHCAGRVTSSRVRVSALQAIASNKCSTAGPKAALEILKDKNEDAEIRIESYLAAISCPNANLANEVIKILDEETISQVQNFIFSNLQAIRDSADDTLKEQKHYLNNIRKSVRNRLPINYKRFSFNSEFSYSLNAVGLGARLDYKQIYSQNGIFPRSNRFNITMQYFGLDFNAIEVSLRQENLERIFEHYLGPKGVINKALEDSNGSADYIKPKIKTQSSFNISKQHLIDIRFDVAVKIFGTELLFLSLGDDIANVLDDIFKYSEIGYEKFKSKKNITTFGKDFKFHSLFLDTCTTFPTGAGIPLELSTQGLAATHFDLAITADLDSTIQRNWNKAKYSLKLLPSIDATLNNRIVLNAHLLSMGLETTTTLHTALGADIRLTFTNKGSGFQAQVKPAREKLDLLRLKTKSDLFLAEVERKGEVTYASEVPFKRGLVSENCNEFLMDFGIRYCITKPETTNSADSTTSPSVFAPPMPPNDLSIYMELEKTYTIVGTFEQDSIESAQKWLLRVTTFRGRDCRLSLDMTSWRNKEPLARLLLITNGRERSVEAGLKDNENEISLYAHYELNKDINRHYKLGLAKKKLSSSAIEYRPIIEVKNKTSTREDLYGFQLTGKLIASVRNTNNLHDIYQINHLRLLNENKNIIYIINGLIKINDSSMQTNIKFGGNEEHMNAVDMALRLESHGSFDGAVNINNKYSGSLGLNAGDGDKYLRVEGRLGDWSCKSTTKLIYDNIKDSNPKLYKIIQNNSIFYKDVEEMSVNSRLMNEANTTEVSTELVNGQNVASLRTEFQYKGAQNSISNQRSGLRGYILYFNAKYNEHYFELVSEGEAYSDKFLINHGLNTSWGTSLIAKGEIAYDKFEAKRCHAILNGIFQLHHGIKAQQWSLELNILPEGFQGNLRYARSDKGFIKGARKSSREDLKYSSQIFDFSEVAGLDFKNNNISLAKIDYKMKKGNSELTITIENTKLNKLHLKCLVSMSRFELNLKGSSQNINAKHEINLRSENHWGQSNLISKNIIDIDGREIGLEISRNVKGDWKSNGEITAYVDITLRNITRLAISANRKISTNLKTGQMQRKTEIQFDEDKLSDAKKRSLKLTSSSEKLHHSNATEQKTRTQISYKNLDNKDLNVEYDQYYHSEASVWKKTLHTKLSGNLIEEHRDISLDLEAVQAEYTDVRFISKCGDMIVANMHGKIEYDQATYKPRSYDISGYLHPRRSDYFKKFEIISNGRCINGRSTCMNYFEMNHNGTKSMQLNITTGENVNTLLPGGEKTQYHNFYIFTDFKHLPLLKLQYNQKRKFINNSLNSINIITDMSYSSDQFIRYVVDLRRTKGHQMADSRLGLELDTNISERFKRTEVHIEHKSFENGSHVIKAANSFGEKTYKVEIQAYLFSQNKRGFELSANLPTDKKKLFLRSYIERTSEHKSKFSIAMQNIRNLDMKLNAEVLYHQNLSKLDLIVNCSLSTYTASPFIFELHTQNGKSVSVIARNTNSIIFSGNAVYVVKTEKYKSIIEGQGQIQYNGKMQNSNFKLVKQIYDIRYDKEVGHSLTLNANLGPKNTIATLKVTNKDFNIKFSICEEKKQCTNIQLQSSVVFDKENKYVAQYALLILVDLREIGYPYEFELQSKLAREDDFKYEYVLDSIIISNSNMKYQFIITFLPDTSKLLLKMPTREILLETEHKSPILSQNVYGKYEYSIAFYGDRMNRPMEVVRLLSQVDLTRSIQGDSYNTYMKGRVTLEQPEQRTLTVSSIFASTQHSQRIIPNITMEVICDIFKLPSQKIIFAGVLRSDSEQINITSHQFINSTGFGFNYNIYQNFGIDHVHGEINNQFELRNGNKLGLMLLTANLHKTQNFIEFNVDSSSRKPLLGINLTFENKLKPHSLLELNLTYNISGTKPVIFLSNIGYNHVLISISKYNTLNATVESNNGGEISFQVVSMDKEILKGQVKTVNSYSDINKDSWRTFMKLVKDNLEEEVETIASSTGHTLENIHTSVAEHIQVIKYNTEMNLSSTWEKYEDIFAEVINDLHQDSNLKPIIDKIAEYCNEVQTFLTNLLRINSELWRILHSFKTACINLISTTVEESLLPVLRHIEETAAKYIRDIYTETVIFLQPALAVFEKYMQLMWDYAGKAGDTVKPFLGALSETGKALNQRFPRLKDFGIKSISLVKSFVRDIQSQLSHLELKNKILSVLLNIVDSLKDILFTTESSLLLDKLSNILKCVLEDKHNVDLNGIITLLESSSISIYNSAGRNWYYIWYPLYNAASISINNLMVAPKLVMQSQVSIINYILNENWTQLAMSSDLYQRYSVDHFKLRGQLVLGGKNAFTFDGQYITYNGSCNCILTKDVVDSNFTVIANFNNGDLASLYVSDGDDDFIEITKLGALRINGNPMEYPQHYANFHIWRLYNSIRIYNDYGLDIYCSVDLTFCNFEVNIFYINHLHGLFGNGNSEPWDDFVQIDGTLSQNASLFVENYSDSQCTRLSDGSLSTYPENDNVIRSDICNEVFGENLRLYMPFFPSEIGIYHRACDIAVAKMENLTERYISSCNIAFAYGFAIRRKLVSITLPSKCLQCSVKEYDYDESFTVKIPNTMADMVFVVDISETNTTVKKLANTIVGNVRAALETRGFSDIHIAVVVFSQYQRYPSLITSDDGKLNYQGNITSVRLNGPTTFTAFNSTDLLRKTIDSTKNGEYLKIVRYLQSKIISGYEMAYELAFQYPFRPNAAKSVVGIQTDSSKMSKEGLRLFSTHDVFKRFDGSIFHFIAPVEGVSLEEVPLNKLTGFNSRLIATPDGKDYKKRQKLVYKDNKLITAALRSGGWVFPSQFFSELGPLDQQKVVNQITNSIADSLYKTEITAECKCSIQNGLTGDYSCQAKALNFLPNKKLRIAT